VLVLERRHLVGGVCVTEETFAGFKVSTAAYVVTPGGGVMGIACWNAAREILRARRLRRFTSG
jgi:phytoene dehydrogenase-like protein